MQTMEQPTPELLAKRNANLKRKQRQRAREKARSHQAMLDHLERQKGDRMNALGVARRTQRNQCMLGEISPGVDARTLEEALEVARGMARALNVSDVQEGESLCAFERRVFEAWVSFDKFVAHNDAAGGGGHAPYLNRETGELSPGVGRDYWIEHCGGFNQSWKPLPGAKEKIDLASLPRLKRLQKLNEPEPKRKPTLVLAPPPPIPEPQPNAVNFAWVPPNAQRYLRGG